MLDGHRNRNIVWSLNWKKSGFTPIASFVAIQAAAFIRFNARFRLGAMSAVGR